MGRIPLIPGRLGNAGHSTQRPIQRELAEAFSDLGKNLLPRLESIHARGPHALGVVAAGRGDGCTCVAVGVCVALARAGRRVLLVDANFRAPDIHRLFKIAPSPGLAEMIEGTAEPGEVIAATDTMNLSLIPACRATVDPASLLAWPDLIPYLASVGREFQHVVIDLPALLESTDGHPILPHADGILLILDGSTNPGIAAQVMTLLERLQAKRVGTALNRTRGRS